MNDEDVPITVCVEHVTATDPLDDLFGFEAAQKRQQIEELTEKNGKLQFAPWRVFINHIDSYHGEILADVRVHHFLILETQRSSLLLSRIVRRRIKGYTRDGAHKDRHKRET